MVGLVHALVAWGFTLYLVVNIVDVLYGFIPGFYFFPDHIIGKFYRVFVYFFTVMVLFGVIFTEGADMQAKNAVLEYQNELIQQTLNFHNKY